MSNSNIVFNSQSDFLAFIRSEAMANGNLSIRGVARCCGVARAAIIDGGHFKSQKLAQILSEHGFEAGHLSSNGFPPQAVWLCIEYFAYESKAKAPMAKQLARTFGSIGVMTTLQQLNAPINPNRRLTDAEVVDLMILKKPTIHQMRFDRHFYDELARLTGLQSDGHKRPAWWGSLTKEWVYDMLPAGVTAGLHACRKAHGGWDKLHQYLSEDGLEIFDRHMQMLAEIMDYSTTVNDVRRLLRRKMAKFYQHELFDDCRKDGVLSISKQLQSIDVYRPRRVSKKKLSRMLEANGQSNILSNDDANSESA